MQTSTAHTVAQDQNASNCDGAFWQLEGQGVVSFNEIGPYSLDTENTIILLFQLTMCNAKYSTSSVCQIQTNVDTSVSSIVNAVALLGLCAFVMLIVAVHVEAHLHPVLQC